MLKKYLLILYLVFSYTLLFSSSEKPKAQKGILDLRQWDFQKRGIIKLNGEWEFYWKELKLPNSFLETPKKNKHRFY